MNDTIPVCKDCLKERQLLFRKKHPIESLKIGDYVKCSFVSKDNKSEGFWIEIKEINTDNITGRIDNDPIHQFDFSHNSIIVFKYEHINDILQDWLEYLNIEVDK